MFNRKKDLKSSDNKIYTKQLLPPEGYEFDCGIATTYSLDLDTLILVSLCLGLNRQSISNKTSETEVLNAMNNIIGKIVVFCEAGQIKASTNSNNFLFWLEKIVKQIQVPSDNNNKFPAFHPKVWLIKYKKSNENTNEGQKKEFKYRVIILSRNLSKDKSWDLVVAVDSAEGMSGKTNIDTKPIKEFVYYLKKQFDKEDDRVEILKNILNDIDNISFEDKLDFYPIGIKTEAKQIKKEKLFNDENKVEYDKVVVMTPFITWNVIENILKKTNKLYLFSRKNEIDKCNDLYKYNQNNNQDNKLVLLVKNPNMYSDNQEEKDDTNLKNKHQTIDDNFDDDIHAKIYIAEKRNKKKYVDMYLGSMNATYSALNSNIEFVAGIQNNKENGKIYDCDSFLEDLLVYRKVNEDFKDKISIIDEGKSPFIEYKNIVHNDEIEESDRLVKKMQDIIKTFISCNPNGELEQENESSSNKNKLVIKLNDKYKIESCKEKFDVYLEPVGFENKNKKYEFTDSIEFEINKEDKLRLTQFYKLKIEVENNKNRVERTIFIPTKGLSTDVDRRDEAEKNIINDMAKFVEYLMLKFGGRVREDYDSSEEKDLGFSGDSYYNYSISIGIYETLLKNISNVDMKEDDIERLINLYKNIMKVNKTNINNNLMSIESLLNTFKSAKKDINL